MSEDSLKKRYFYKLSTNFIGLLINMVTQAIIPRGLGPKAYGDFNFLTNIFNQIASFLDMGTSLGFYTKLSQRPGEFSLVSFYLYFTGIVSLLIAGFVFVASLSPFYTGLWPEQEVRYIYMAAVFSILTWISQVFNKMIDAYGLTVTAESAKIIQKISGMVLILLLYVSHQLNLTNYFYYHYLLLFFLGGILVWIMERRGYSMKKSWRLSHIQINEYLREFYQYSHPLLIYAIVGMIVGIFDRWLLQFYSGSIQQGFYSLSYQIGAICFLFTSAMTPLLMREFSIAHGNKDVTRMALLFRRYIPLLYSIAAYFSCFIAVQADKVIFIFGGDKYKEAVMTVAIMAFYPVHQTYGQLSGSVFYASGQTAVYRNIGITFMLIGLPVTYFLIAPENYWGLDAGSTGLAIKMVLLQFFAINVQLYYNSRLLKLSFIKYFGHQLFSMVCLFMTAVIAAFIVERILMPGEHIITTFLLTGALYTIMVICLVCFLPVVFGLKRQDIQSVFQR